MLFSYGTSLMQIISGNNQTLLCQSSSPLLDFLLLEKLIDSTAKFHIRKLKIGFWLDKVNNCVCFLNCCRQHELRFTILISAHIIFNFLRHSCSLRKGKKSCDCITSLKSSSQQLVLAKLCNAIIMILYFIYYNVVTTLSNQFLNLCSCNHWPGRQLHVQS